MPARDPLAQPPDGDNRDSKSPRRSVLWLILAAVAFMGVILLYLANHFPDALSNNPLAGPRLVYMLAWGAVLGASLIVQWRSRPGQAISYIAVWLAIGAALMLAYSFFHG